MKTVSDIAGKMNGQEIGEEKKETQEKKEESEGDAGFTIPPELLKKLPQMMSLLSGSGLGASQVASENGGQQFGLTDKKRRALLSALKPYLSDKRCAVIDGLLQFEGLAGILSAFYEK